MKTTATRATCLRVMQLFKHFTLFVQERDNYALGVMEACSKHSPTACCSMQLDSVAHACLRCLEVTARPAKLPKALANSTHSPVFLTVK